MPRVGFLGCGNMAKAIMGGILSKGLVNKEYIYTSNAHEETAQAIAEEFGVHAGTDNHEVARNSDVLFIAVKPQMYEEVLKEVAPDIEGQIVVSIAPGKTLAWLEETLGGGVKVVRTAPNTPALVGEGITAYCGNGLVTEQDLEQVVALISSFGKVVPLEEGKLDVASAVGGSTPAFVYMFIEALADGGVAEGLTRPVAQMMAAQAVLGSAKMVLESGSHPGALKDAVCSPGGSTIRGVQALENGAFRGTTITAMRDTVARARQL